MEILAIDVETIPHQNLPDGCMPTFDPNTVKTGNAGHEKAQEKIDKEYVKWKDSLSKKMSLDPTLCQVCTFVGMIFDTEAETIKDQYIFQVESDLEVEYDCVYGAWNFIKKCKQDKIPLVSFNGINFDLPVLIFRAMALDIPIPDTRWVLQKYTTEYHYDLMQVLVQWNRERWKSLDFYLRIFNIGGKGIFDGSQVYPAWQAGEYNRIQDYCEKDVLQLIELFQRVEPWIT